MAFDSTRLEDNPPPGNETFAAEVRQQSELIAASDEREITEFLECVADYEGWK